MYYICVYMCLREYVGAYAHADACAGMWRPVVSVFLHLCSFVLLALVFLFGWLVLLFCFSGGSFFFFEALSLTESGSHP